MIVTQWRHAQPVILILAAFACFVSLAPGVARADQAVTLACNNFPPLKIEHPGSDGLPGSDVDLLRALFQRADVPLEISYVPWKRAFAAAQEGRVDGLCSCSYAADRTADFLFSDEIGSISTGVFTLKGNEPKTPIETLQSLKPLALFGQAVGVVDGYALKEDLDAIGIPGDLASDDSRALEMLARRRYRFLYSYEAPIKFLVKYPLSDSPAPPQLSYQEIRARPYYLCLSRKMAHGSELLGRLNAVLAEMRKDGTIARILDRYR
ncbi:MAG TPA: transporter substrate-binding domain-containing protein [Dongiaceae bacterium]|nr:transporter substrate-binding domain-containing protein [Dongiaceae bacterium]